MCESEITLEKIEELFDFLKGNALPPCFVKNRKLPKMSARAAFSIIYILQEVYHIIPDHYELCYRCKGLYDSCSEGDNLDWEKYIMPKYLSCLLYTSPSPRD